MRQESWENTFGANPTERQFGALGPALASAAS